MPTFLIHEIQRVHVVREVQARTAKAAYAAFCDGEGIPAGKDGEVISSDLVSSEPVRAA